MTLQVQRLTVEDLTIQPSAVAAIPYGWNIRIEWFHEAEYPGVSVQLSKDFGRIQHNANACEPTLDASLSKAIADVVEALKAAAA